jgi:pyruvate dehydrogenase E1 component beta subunit
MPQMTYREAIRVAMAEELRHDDRVLFMGEDIADMGGSQGVSKGMLEEFGPGRIRNTPISEEGIVGAAVGAAMSGLRPIVEIMYMDFTAMAMDPLVGQAAKWRYMTGGQVTIPVTVRTQGGAGWQSGAQHASMLEGWFAHVPGLKVVMPSQPDDARLLLKAAIRDENPVLFVEHRDCYPRKGEVDTSDPETAGELGVGRILREGTDCTIVCWGGMPWAAMEAAETLQSEDGISLEIIDPRTLQPFDLGIVLESVRRTNRCVVAHEAVKFGGFGAEVASLVQEHAFDHLDAPVLRIGEKWAPVPFAPVLEAHIVPGAPEIIEAVRSVAYATA